MDLQRSFVRSLQLALVAGSLVGGAALPGVASAGALVALDPEPRSGPPAPREPPPFAFEACADKQEGATCTVELPDRTLEGTCVVSRDDRLFCMPDNMPPPPPHGGDPRGPTL
jgi:hypothetical protein